MEVLCSLAVLALISQALESKSKHLKNIFMQISPVAHFSHAKCPRLVAIYWIGYVFQEMRTSSFYQSSFAAGVINIKRWCHQYLCYCFRFFSLRTAFMDFLKVILKGRLGARSTWSKSTAFSKKRHVGLICLQNKTFQRNYLQIDTVDLTSIRGLIVWNV